MFEIGPENSIYQSLREKYKLMSIKKENPRLPDKQARKENIWREKCPTARQIK